jgi:hypothetical protein
MHQSLARLAPALPLLLAAPATAQLEITWFTIDCGGGTSAAGDLTLTGTIGQHDAGSIGGGGLTLTGGFWGGSATGPAPCYANCDGSTTNPILNVADFSCFLTKFAAGDPYANCDGSTTAPTLNVADFSCFLTKFAAGCS